MRKSVTQISILILRRNKHRYMIMQKTHFENCLSLFSTSFCRTHILVRALPISFVEPRDKIYLNRLWRHLNFLSPKSSSSYSRQPVLILVHISYTSFVHSAISELSGTEKFHSESSESMYGKTKSSKRKKRYIKVQ